MIERTTIGISVGKLGDLQMITRVTIDIEQSETGLFYATSPDFPGLLVAKPSWVECWADIPRAIAEIRALQDDR